MAASRDVYGFPLGPLTDAESACRLAASTALSRQAKQWQGVYTPNKEFGFTGLKVQQTAKLLARKGVPVELRPALWFWLSGASEKKQQAPAGYYEMKSRAETLPRESLFAIEEDVLRTFRQNPLFQTREGLDAFRRLLVATCQHLPETGYVSGMSHMAGFLLAVMGLNNEEQAFWVLVTLLQERLFCYCSGQMSLGSKVELKVLDNLVEKKLPKIYAHLHRMDCTVASITAPWFTSMLTTTLPSETCARVWDSLLLEGPKVLLRVGLALLKRFEPTILASNGGPQLKKILDARMCRLFDADNLLALAFKGVGTMSASKICPLRTSAKLQIEQQLMEQKARLDLVIVRAQ